MSMCAVRGATTVQQNSPDAVITATLELMNALISANSIDIQSIVTLWFTLTPDITAYNPAKALRENQDNWGTTPIMCVQEAAIDGMLPLCLRVLIQWEPSGNLPSVKPVYLHMAQMLRPDINSGV